MAHGWILAPDAGGTRVRALPTAGVGPALHLQVAAGGEPAVVRLAADPYAPDEPAVLDVDLLPGARCVLVEDHTQAATRRLRVNVRAGRHAQLDHFRVVLGGDSDLAHEVHASVADGARYAQHLVATGAASHSQRTELALDGPEARASVRGVLLAAGAALEQQVHTRHAAARSQSAVETLALASGHARVEAEARTIIEAGCDGADVRQRLAGIAIAGQPRLLLRPHLEIHHDDVQAAHGATWGALPEDALFHARQRGLDESSAKAMIVDGLARAVLSRDAELPAEIDVALGRAVRAHLTTHREALNG